MTRGWLFGLVAMCAAMLGACNGATFTGGEKDAAGAVGKDAAGSDLWGGFPDVGKLPPPKKDTGTCGGQNIPIVLTKKGAIPDLFLVVDRSGSMMLPINLLNPFGGTKWGIMSKVLVSLVSAYKANIRFGLSLFPGGGPCEAGKIDVPLQMGNDPAIKQRLTKTGPTGNTPTHLTLAKVRIYLKSVPLTKGKRYALLATDGAPNCGAQKDTDTTAETLLEVQKLVASGVKVFVLGFGGIVAGNPGFLNKLAMAGGVPNTSGSQKFYPASNEKELKKALFSMAGGIIPPPCTYRLQSRPPDPNKVTVTFDGVPVARSLSSKNGWNYTGGGHEISFFGSACARLRQGQVKRVRFLFGCKGPVIK